MAIESSKTLFTSLKFSEAIAPASEDKIKETEKLLGITFPSAYREFLAWMGTDRAGILLGSEWMLEDLPNLGNKMYNKMVEMNFPKPYPEDAFVFLGKQDYEFVFLRLNEGTNGDESLVYRYHATLDMTDFAAIANNFNEWLNEQIRDHVRKLQALGRKP